MPPAAAIICTVEPGVTGTMPLTFAPEPAGVMRLLVPPAPPTSSKRSLWTLLGTAKLCTVLVPSSVPEMLYAGLAARMQSLVAATDAA